MSSYDEHLISQAGGDGDELDLDAIQARADEATEGPWVTVRHDLSLYVQSKHANLQANLGYVGNRPEPDAEFIAHARTDVPALLALVREQAAKLDAVRELHQPIDVEVFDNPTTNGSHIEYQCQACDETAYPCATMTALESKP